MHTDIHPPRSPGGRLHVACRIALARRLDGCLPHPRRRRGVAAGEQDGDGCAGRPDSRPVWLGVRLSACRPAPCGGGIPGDFGRATRNWDVGAAGARRLLAHRRPDLARALVSLEGGPAEAAATPSFRRAMRFAPWIKWFGGVRRIRGKVRSGLIAASGDPHWVTDSVVDAYTAGAASDLDATLKAFLRMTAASEPEPLVPHLREVRCPVWLLLGTAPHDGRVPTGDVELLRQGLSSLTIDSVPGSGHYIQEEDPGAVVAAVARTRAAPVLGHEGEGKRVPIAR